MDLKKYALENKIAVIMDEGLEFILNLIEENQYKNILELGTAIGYSSINFASVDRDIKITTVERNKEMYQYAKKAIKYYYVDSQIELIYADALDVEIDKKFDIIFIDAAKGQYIRLFEKFQKNLAKGGVIICDNLAFHGLVKEIDTIKNRNLKQLIKKIKTFTEYLENNSEYQTEFYTLGDGISVSRLKNGTDS